MSSQSTQSITEIKSVCYFARMGSCYFLFESNDRLVSSQRAQNITEIKSVCYLAKDGVMLFPVSE